MATISQVAKQSGLEVDSEGNYILPAGHRLPGWTVDALLEKGDVPGARAELMRLIQEGIDSGPGIAATPEFWERLYARARGEAPARGMTEKNLTLSFSELAEQDIEQEIDYLRDHAGPAVTDHYLRSVHHTASLLLVAPYVGRVCGFESIPHRDVRRFAVHSPFQKRLMFYTPTASAIRVERILHGARNWASLFQ